MTSEGATYDYDEARLLVATGMDAESLARQLKLSPLKARAVARAMRSQIAATPLLDLLPAPTPRQSDKSHQKGSGHAQVGSPLKPNPTRTATEKYCGRCLRWLPLGEFNSRIRRRVSGETILTYRAHCRDCELTDRTQRRADERARRA